MFTKLKKKITVALLAVIAAVIAFAAAFMLTPKTQKAYAASSGTAAFVSDISGQNAVQYASFSDAWSAATSRGTAMIGLCGDVTVGTRLTVAEGQNIRLALNGYKLTSTYSGGGGSGAILVNGTFTLEDGNSSVENTITDAVSGTSVTVRGGVITGCKEGGVMVDKTGNFTMKSGNIAGNAAYCYGAGVRNYGTFTMSGGMIGYNNVTTTTTGGCGGVCVDKGTFTLSGGTICNNKGSGVWLPNADVERTFIMTQGTISGNSTSSDGGGVNVNGGTFEMSGGTIAGNTATGSGVHGTGGGVYLTGSSAKFTMSGGTIGGSTDADKNTAATGGGGVYINGGAFTMSGTATVTGNAVNTGNSTSYWGGGGVYLNSGTFIMDDSGTSITNNKAASSSKGGNGGGVLVRNGTFTMNAGAISGNTTLSSGGLNGVGGGVYQYGGTFEMKGSAKITANKSGGGAGVCVHKGTFTMGGSAAIDANELKNGEGGGVSISEGGAFTMNGGTISNHTARVGGGVQIYNGGTFTMNGGTISGNKATLTGTVSTGGGGVNVNRGTFIMTDGKISDNSASYYGGGVFVCADSSSLSGGTFKMSGGTISGNTTDRDGGGVRIGNGTFEISGAPVISGNKKKSAVNNVSNGQTMTVTAALTEGAQIYLQDPGTITGYRQDKKPSKYFFSDYAPKCIYVSDAQSGTVTVGNHTGGTATCSAQAVCSNCGEGYGELGAHMGGTATCSAKAVCSNCGESYGEVNANNHTFEDHVCTGCGKAAAAYVTANGTDKDYLTFAEAWAAANAATTASATPATITMLADATSTDTFVVNAGQYITLEMKKHKLEFTGDSGSVIRVLGVFTVQQGRTDSVSAEHEISDPTDPEGKKVTVLGSLITGGKGSGENIVGGGVFVDKGGEFTLGSNVAIAGNTAGYGGGVRVDEGAKFTMNASAQIIYNKATNDGGGLCVYNSASVTLNQGIISQNAACAGGGIYFEGGSVTYTIENTVIRNNVVTTIDNIVYTGNGGGVYVDGSSVTMSGMEALVSYNTVTQNGGGVYVAKGTFTMSDNASISGNTATGWGGGVYVAVSGTFMMSDRVTIFGNTANAGGGVLVANGKFNVSGTPQICDNTANDKENNCVNTGRGGAFITVKGTLTDRANIRISGSVGDVATGYTQKESDGKYKPSKYFHYDNVNMPNPCIYVSNEQNGTVTIGYHTGGTATCTEAAVCSNCGEIYGDALGHDIDSIVIDTYPTVYNNYTAGDTFDPTGMVIKPHCTRCQDTEAVTDYTISYISSDNKLHFGDNYVTVVYGDFTVNVTGLYVRAKQAEITWQYAENISGDEGAIRWVDFASNKYTIVFNPQVEDLGNHFRAKFTGIDGNTVTMRATNEKISVEGDSQTFRNAGTYILRLDEADFTDYDFKNTNEVQVEITPAEIELNNTDNFYWTLNEYNSALRSGYIDETTFKYYSAAGAGRTRVVRSIVRNRNREVTIGLYGARSTENNASGGVYDIVYGDGCTATARGKYTATAKLTFTAAENGNYKFKITDTIDPDRHMTATINADGTVDITKEWYVAVIDNGLLSQDKDGGTYGMEWGLAGWTFGNYQTQYAPRLEHGDPGEYNGVKMFTEDDNLVTFELYKVETTTPVTRVQIGETFNRAAFADYINGSVPAGNYVLKVTAGAYTTGEHEHWYTDDENIHGGGVTSGIYYDEFTREFNFTVAKADFSSTNAGTLNGKSYTYTYDGKLHLYKDFTLSADIYDTRDGEWAKAAYNGYFGGAQLYYKLNRWNGGDYVTESGLDGYQNQSQTPKNADTYTLLFTLRALNYNDLSGDNSFTVIINKAEVEVPADVSDILMVDYKYEVPQDALYTVSGIAIFTTAGEHTVTLALKDAVNYKWKDSENSTVTVKVTLTMHDHEWETEFTVDKKPTVNEKGSKSKHCSICDAKSEITEIDKLRAEISASDENGSEGNEVIVSVSDGFEPEFSLTITEISKDNFGDYQSVADEANGVVSFVYEVRLTKNGVAALPDGTLTVKLKIPENLRGKNYKLLAVAGDTATEMQYTVEGNYAVISADALEDFVFVGEKPAPAKNNTAWLVLIIILSLVIVGEVGYIVYRKFFLNKVREGK